MQSESKRPVTSQNPRETCAIVHEGSRIIVGIGERRNIRSIDQRRIFGSLASNYTLCRQFFGEGGRFSQCTIAFPFSVARKSGSGATISGREPGGSANENA